MGPNGGYCHNPVQFNPLIQALDVEGEPQAYWGKDRVWGMAPESLPPPMAEECFRHAVVVGGENADPAAAMRYVASSMFGTEMEKMLPTTTTIIQRGSTRRILNIDAVVELLREMRFPNIQVVDMGANTTKEQLQIVRCSGLLIGMCHAGGQRDERVAPILTLPHHAQALLVQLWRGRLPSHPARFWWSYSGPSCRQGTSTVASRRRPCPTTGPIGASARAGTMLGLAMCA